MNLRHGASFSASSATPVQSASVGHYENFPVASWLCPKPLRPAVAAIYHFARTADDLADEGDLPAATRLEQLNHYRLALDQACQQLPAADTPWSRIMQPLHGAIARHQLPPALLHDLLTAFERDVQHTAQGHVYACHDDLLDYARYSANPVGRLMLHLYGVQDASSWAHSDAICSALQLFNFWQDVSVDVPRGRYYLPQDLCHTHGVDPRCPASAGPSQRQALLSDLLDRARILMLKGRPLPAQVAQQAGWLAGRELQLVMEGGLRIGEKTRALGPDIAHTRPRIGSSDGLLMVWRALMRH